MPGLHARQQRLCCGVQRVRDAQAGAVSEHSGPHSPVASSHAMAQRRAAGADVDRWLHATAPRRETGVVVKAVSAPQLRR
jgi:hypothetical protein